MNPTISDASVSVDKLKLQYQGNGPGPGSSSQKSLFAALEQSEVWGKFYVGMSLFVLMSHQKLTSSFKSLALKN